MELNFYYCHHHLHDCDSNNIFTDIFNTWPLSEYSASRVFFDLPRFKSGRGRIFPTNLGRSKKTLLAEYYQSIIFNAKHV